ncbi:ABC transporter substrate-binding protein [Bradyrhizobium sp.]|uniref:ABC transporter substrate-binding protein n=1 Tax=Bradyrhizobium sp. TaxID=376 RepID=UPI0023A6AF42|nr:ABC transporter substrate-binding protein [Bradyrhizobium sp.]MDE1935492.1 ABC transporter substrate-binding protein [Bradyrhizobium sp.]
MRHALAISAASLAVLAASGAAAADHPSLEKKNLTIAVGGSISQMNKVAYFVALNRKYFEQEGLAIESNAFASGTAALQSLVGGSADVAEGAYEHTLRMQTKGVNLTCLVPYGRYPGNVLVVRKSEADKIKAIADLKGKKIGVSAPGSSTHNFAAGLMERAGVSWKDASYVSIGTGPSAVAAMKTGGELDALVNLDPAINTLVEDGDAVVLSDSRTAEGTHQAFGGDYLADCLMVKSDFLKANPNTSQAIVNAIVHAMQWLKTASIDDIMKSLPPSYYKSGEALYRVSLQRNLPAFQWDGIVKQEAAQNVLDSIAVLDPVLKHANINFSLTYDNNLVETALRKYHSPVSQ